jgi:hypothetical protein
MGMNSRNISGFGKRIEYWIIGLLVKEGIDVYVPFIDYDGTDLLIKKSNGTYIEIQIKATSKTIAVGYSASFGRISYEKRKNYFFIFYSEKLNIIWILSSDEFLKYSAQYKTGKNIGRRAIEFTGKRKDKKIGKYEEYVYERFEKYIAKDFSRFK